jgi:hypothetical protein
VCGLDWAPSEHHFNLFPEPIIPKRIVEVGIRKLIQPPVAWPNFQADTKLDFEVEMSLRKLDRLRRRSEHERKRY